MRVSDFNFNLLRALGFSAEQVEEANVVICSPMKFAQLIASTKVLDAAPREDLTGHTILLDDHAGHPAASRR